MTREEAIECNKNLRMYMKLSDKNQPCKFLEDNYIALDMAIKSLEQEPKMLSEIEHLHKYISKLETQIVEQEPIDKSAMMYDIYMEGVNMSGEYQGCWVRFKDIEKIVDKYIGSEE